MIICSRFILASNLLDGQDLRSSEFDEPGRFLAPDDLDVPERQPKLGNR